VVEAEHFC
jgi:hypothetical protein